MKRFLRDYRPSPARLKAVLIRPFQLFFRAEAASSILLICATVVALLWANSPFSGTYHHFWESELSITLGEYAVVRSLREWINEGLMAIFFFTVGIEIKREVSAGELASLKKALLPVGAAFGGMVFPALIYVAFNLGMPTVRGWGIPMATDIAFALGALFVLGKRVPVGLRVFLAAFAIADDLGAVVVIALFYTKTIHMSSLAFGILLVLLMVVANLSRVKSTLVYALLGVGLWFAFLAQESMRQSQVILAICTRQGKYDTDRFLRRSASTSGIHVAL
jgi:NhaA family Na+:H+ antiporter